MIFAAFVAAAFFVDAGACAQEPADAPAEPAEKKMTPVPLDMSFFSNEMNRQEDAALSSTATQLFRASEDSAAIFYKNPQGKEIPVIDNQGKVIFRRPEDIPESEMTETDFYQTLTPAEKAVLSDDPQTGPALLAAAIQIARIGRTGLAKQLLQKAAEAEGTPADWAAVIDKVGAHRVFTFGHERQLGEPATQAVTRAFEEAQKYWRNGDTLRAAFDHVFIGSQEDKIQALLDLRKGGDAAFAILLDKLFSDDAETSARAQTIFSHLGRFAIDGLSAALQTSDETKLIRIAETLAQTPSLPTAAPLILRYFDPKISDSARAALAEALESQLGAVPEKSNAAEKLFAEGMRYFDRVTPLGFMVDGRVSVWRWNRDTDLPEWTVLTDTEIYRSTAAEFLAGAACIDRSNTEILSAAMTAMSEKLVYEKGLDQPPDTDSFTQAFPSPTASELENALAFALRTRHFQGGVIPAVLLGPLGNSSMLVRQSGPSVIVQAAVSPDRRLRFAALSSLISWRPTESFSGAGNVSATLRHFASSSGSEKFAVAVPKLELTTRIGNFFINDRRKLIPAVTGTDLIRLAQNDADIEFIVAVPYVRQPDMRTVAQTFAVDYRTGDIPIIIVFEDETRIDQAEDYGQNEKNVFVAPVPLDLEASQWILDALYRQTGVEQVPAEVRLRQAKAAVEMLTVLFSGVPSICEPQEEEFLAALFLARPELLDESLTFAQTVASGSIQAILAEKIGDGRIDRAHREKYLAAFGEHLQKHGVLLRGPDITRLYDRYNASAAEEQAVQKLLSDALDRLEEAQGSRSKSDSQ